MRININLDKTKNYEDLQSQVADEIAKSLDESDVLTFTQRDAVPDCLNLTFFIRETAQVFLSHSLADRNYLFSTAYDEPLLANFQFILVPGEWTRKAILSKPKLGLLPHRVVVVGHPRIDLLRRMQAQSEQRPTPSPGQRLSILWAPAHDRHGTRKGAVVSSYPGLESHLEDLRMHHDVVVSLHPRNRQSDKSALIQPLIDCDVVITDASSVMFEAWAIGKPVIFPRWLVGDNVIDRFRGSAEAHVHEQRIGLHSDSFDECLQMLAAGPTIGADVEGFMEQYLSTYRSHESSTSMIVSAMRLFADPEWAERKSCQESGLMAMAAAAAKKNSVRVRTGSARASIQMLQMLALQDQAEGFAHAMSALRSVQSGSQRLLSEIAMIECDYRLGTMSGKRRASMLARLEQVDTAAANAFRGRLAFLQGRLDESFEYLQKTIKGAQSYAVWRLVPRLIQQMGMVDLALPMLENLWKQYKGLEVIEDMLTLELTESEITRVLALLLGSRKVIPQEEFRDLHMRVLWRAGHIKEAIEVARESAIKATRLEPGWRQKNRRAIEGWGPKDSLPVWHLPFESLDGQSVARAMGQGSGRWSGALANICAAIDAENLPLFLSRETLRRFLKSDPADFVGDDIELGLVWTADSADALNRLAMAGLLEPLDHGSPRDCRRFRMPNGITVHVRLYCPGKDSTMTLCEDGVETTVPAVSLVNETRNGLCARIPSNPELHLDAVFGAENAENAACAPLMSGRENRIIDPDNLRFRLYREISAALAAEDFARARDHERILYRLGDKDYCVYLAKMDQFHLCEDLPGLMEEARFIMHIGDGVDAAFHVDLWYPYLKAVDPSMILAIRSKPLFDLLRKTRPELHAIYIKAGLEAEWLVVNCPKLAAIHYISNTGSTVHFLRFNHVTHIWLGHGDSEKAASCHKFFRAYDEIWCAGMAQIDRFRNAGMSYESLRFRVVGRPMLRDLINEANNPTTGTFLYLPTWEGFQSEQDYTSIALSERFLPGIVSMIRQNALVKFHPWTGNRVAGYREVEQKLAEIIPENQAFVRVLDRRHPVVEMMPTASFLVADVSSVVSDFLPTGRPIFLHMPDRDGLRMTMSAMPMDSYCYVFRKEDELLELIKTVILDNNDYLREQRLRARNYFVNIEQTTDGGFEGALRDVILEHDHRTLPWEPSGLESPSVSPLALPMIVGHRGAKLMYAENSLSGFQAVARMNGLDAVEFDLHLTADGEIAVLHDPTLNRTTNATGPVYLRTMGELHELRLKKMDPKDKGFLDEGIPSLGEVLDVFAPTGLEMFIELKNNALGDAYQGLPEKTLAILKSRNLLDRCTLTSFSPDVLNHLRYLNRDVRLMASVNYRSIEMMGGVKRCLETFARIPDCGVTLHHEAMAQLCNAGITLDFRRFGMWVLNTPDQISLAISLGVRQIFTDLPELAISMLSDRTSNRSNKSR